MSDDSKIQANKRLIRDYTERVFNAHDADAVAGFMPPDAQWHGGTLGTVKGAENIAGMLRGMFAALPDLVAVDHGTVADEDTVSVRFVVEGTQQGELFGIPATGRRIRWDAVDVYRISNGKIVEEWAFDDTTAILNQVGAYTPPWLAYPNPEALDAAV